ncbi:hypothetical protein [Actinomadura sp. WMMA1423]|uniref:YqeB family protein n=1 Tax=Actinomadura sp. WMMA1423 TaxID=2591108 RepID=UPI0011477420|nr:hypothetical protein [Actinomadura sp. WMMA1423]
MRRHQREHPDALTTLARPVWAWAVLYITAAALAAGLGWLVRVFANWLASLEWAPMRGPARLLVSIPEPWLTAGLVALGAVAGLGLIFFDSLEQVSVGVAGDRVVLKRPGHVQEITRDRIGPVFRDRDHLVLLGRRGEEIAREKCDLSVRELAAAFTGHGYAWTDGDPYLDDFRPWVPKTPDLSEHANSLLKVRAEAMEGSGSAEVVKELRRELARIGVVVRDKGKRQYWRRSDETPLDG